MNTGDEEITAYVRTAAAVLALPLDEDQVRRVAVHLGRSAALAALLDEVPLAPHDEPAEIYCPAPWITSKNSHFPASTGPI